MALREAQVPLLSFVLFTAGMAKLVLRGPRAPEGARFLDVLRHHRGLTVTAALAEVGLGTALVVAPTQNVRVVTIIWFVGATWVVDELRTRRPDAGCGCFGALSTTRIGLRVLLRPMFLAIAAITTLGVTDRLHTAELLGVPGLCLAAEIVCLALLSPELGVVLTTKRTHVPCGMRQRPLSHTLADLHASRAWREHLSLLESAEPVEVWRELCWRFLVFPARSGGRDRELVFAVSLSGSRRPEVRVALVDPPPTEPPLLLAVPSDA